MDEVNKKVLIKVDILEKMLSMFMADKLPVLYEILDLYSMLYTKLVSEFYSDQREKLFGVALYQDIVDKQSGLNNLCISVEMKRELAVRMVIENEILDRLNNLMNDAKTRLATVNRKAISNSEYNKYLELVSSYDSVLICLDNTDVALYKYFYVCDTCGNEMDVSRDCTYMVCYTCGDTGIDMKENMPDSMKNVPKSKTGNFKPNRHFKRWIDRILAKEPEEEIGDSHDPANYRGEKLIAKIRQVCVNKGLTTEYITVRDIRSILKSLGCSIYNENIPLIMKKLTNRGPPNLSEDSYYKVYSLFIQVMEIRDSIKKDGRSNRIYYPYYIYKIFDIYLEGDERKAMGYIHLHSNHTLTSNDEEWRLICNAVPSLHKKYKPTVQLLDNRY